MRERHEVVLNRPPAEVFELVADYGRLAEWDPAVDRAVRTRGERFEVGSRYDVAARVLGRARVVRYELLHIEPNSKAVYRSAAPGYESVATLEFAPMDGGRTRLSVDGQVRSTGLAKLLLPLLAPLLRRHRRQALASLAQRYAP